MAKHDSSAAIVDHFNELRSRSIRICVHYFFDSGKAGPKSLDNLLRALIKQLILSRDKALQPIESETQAEIRTMFQVQAIPPSTDMLKFILHKLMDETPGVFYLVDGFDDMAEPQIQSFFVLLRTIFRNGNSHGSKLAIFSRETLGRGIDVQKQLSVLEKVSQIRLSLQLLSGDISRFVEALVDEQQLMRKITDDESLLAEIKSKLKANGDKM